MQIVQNDQLFLKQRDLIDEDFSDSDDQRVLTEINPRTTITTSSRVGSNLGSRLYSDLSASAQRRHDILQLRVKQEKSRRRRLIRSIEYQRLRNMVPSIARKPLVSKLTVIEEAIRYIDYLHEAVIERLKTKGLPSCLEGVNVDLHHLEHDDVKNLVFQLVEKQKAAERAVNKRNRRKSSSDDSGRSTHRSRHLSSSNHRHGKLRT